MKKISQITSILLFSIAFSQNNVKIELTAQEFEKDSLMIGAPSASGNINKLYNFTILPNENIKQIRNFPNYSIRIKSKNHFSGNTDYPFPVVIAHYDKKENSVYQSPHIFIEKGNHKIDILDKKLHFKLPTESPSNKEYKNLKNIVKNVEKDLKPYQDNDSKNIEAKQKIIQNYIKKDPDSFVAFWEIVDDFSLYRFHKSYLESLKLFSKNVKNSFSYKEFEKILNIENSSDVGGNFPDINLNTNDKITKVDFSKYKLTLIDYWATTCKPCIKDLPNLVQLHEKYKDQGLNIISIADDTTEKRMDLANKILQENKIMWKNYFDLNKEFPKKLNASGYPLQILVDNNGKIIGRKFGELELIGKEIESYLK